MSQQNDIRMSSNAVRDTFGELCMSRAMDRTRIEQLEQANADLLLRLQEVSKKLEELEDKK